MQKLISRRNEYPLQCINVKNFIKMNEYEKSSQMKIRVKEIEKVLEKGRNAEVKIDLGNEPTSERAVRYLNRMIRSIRGTETTETDFVVELYQLIIKLEGEHKHIHREIHKALGGMVLESSIRRILSQYRNGKLG